MFCHQCGSQVNNDVQFCPNCGQTLSASPGATVVPMYVAPAGVTARPGRWIGEGWQLVKADMGNYALMGLVFLALNTLVPIVLQGPTMAGFHIYCLKRMHG